MSEHDAYDNPPGLAGVTGVPLTQLMRRAFAALKGRTLLASVGLLVGGTGLAAFITAATLPVLTRMYSPADFGVLAAVTGLISILSVSACLRFDIAIPISECDEVAANVLALAVVAAGTTAMLVGAVLLAAAEPLLTLSGQLKILPYAWLVPAGVFAAALNAALQSWLIRRKKFGLIARNRVMQAGIASGTQIAIGAAGVGTLGLLVGPTVGMGAACVALALQIKTHDRSLLPAVSWRRMRKAFTIHHRFPKFSVLEALANTASIQVPVLMIASLAPAAEAGHLLLAIFVVQAPMGLLGAAIGQVFLSHAPQEHRAARLGAFTANVLGGLLKTGVGPLIFGGLLAPVLFAKVFGAEWERAGLLLAWMTPWFILQYLASPLSVALHIVNRQRTALLLQGFGLVLRVTMVYAAFSFGIDGVSEAYAVSGAAFYACYLIAVLRVTGLGVRDVIREFKGALLLIGFWTAVGSAGLLAVHVLSVLRAGAV